MRSRRQRGSVMLFVLVMVGMMTVAILATVELTTSAAILQNKREASAKTRLAFEGAVNRALTEIRDGKSSVPDQRSYQIGDLDVKIDVTDNGASMAKTYKIVGTTVFAGREYIFERIVGNRQNPTPFAYAVFVNENFDPKKSITINGDMVVNGSIASRTFPFNVSGDLESSGTTLSFTASVGANTMLGASKVNMPTVSSLPYVTAALVTWATGTVTNIVFGAGAEPKLIYRLGDVTIGGTVSGNGTIYVDGNVTIGSNLSYTSASDRLVVIATGKITVGAAATSFVGHYFTPTEFVTNATTNNLTKGSIVSQKLTLNGAIQVTHDSYFWDDPTEGAKYRLPGMWP